MALLDLVDQERAAVRALTTAIDTGAIPRPDAARLVELHDAVQADLHTLIRDLRLRSAEMGQLVHAGYAQSIPTAPDAIDGTVLVYKPTRPPAGAT